MRTRNTSVSVQIPNSILLEIYFFSPTVDSPFNPLSETSRIFSFLSLRSLGAPPPATRAIPLISNAPSSPQKASDAPATATALSWQLQAHVLVSLLSYGLLTVGAIVAVFALVQEQRLQAGKLSAYNQLFAPLETTEKLLFGIAAAGFAGLALAISSGISFVDDLLAQHLAHKTVFSLLALLVFGALLAGRFLAGWRGKRAISLYLGGFTLLCLAYFGTRYVLEEILNRSWG